MNRAILLISVLMLCLWVVPCGAADLLNFPPDCDTPGEKVEYSYRAQELLRNEYNTMSRWVVCGMTEDEYDNGVITDCHDVGVCCDIKELTILGPKLKARFPYTEYLTNDEFRIYAFDWFLPRQTRVGSECAKNRTACKEDPYCTTEYMKTVKGPEGDELEPKKDLFKISGKYPIVVDDIPKTTAVIDK